MSGPARRLGSRVLRFHLDCERIRKRFTEEEAAEGEGGVGGAAAA